MLNAQIGTRRRLGPARAAEAAGQAAFMAAAARACLAGAASPFAVACFTAGLYAGIDFKPMLIGCLIGFPWENMTLGGTATVLGCLAALGIHTVVRKIELSQTRLGWRIKDASGGLLAAATALIPGLITGFVGCSDLARAIACPIIAETLAPVILCAGAVNFRRTALLSEERLAVCLLSAIALFGVAQSPAGFLAGAMAGFITLTASYSGAAEGAMAGVVAGAVTAWAAGGTNLAAHLGITGLIAGLTLPLGRRWSALSFLLANLIGVMYQGFFDIAALSPLACAAAGIAYCVLTEDAVERLSGWIAPGISVPDADHLASGLRRAAKERVSALEKVFETLADGYGDVAPGEDEQSMTAKMRLALCDGCPGYEACWGGDGTRAGRLLCSILAKALKGEVLRESDELAPEASRDCRRAAIIPRKLAPVLRGFYEDKKRRAQSRTSAATLSKHFSGAKNVLSRAAADLDDPLYVDNELCGEAAAALEREGIDGASVLVLAGERVEVAATKEEIWMEDEARQAQKALSKALSVPFRTAFSRGGDVTLRLVQAPRLKADVGYACRGLTAKAPCGDSCLASGLSRARVLVALSDGMGSGERAAKESAKTVELIRRFLQADIGDALALDAINQLLLLRNDDEMYATADVCVVDLNGGKARFVKQGACASYIIRKKRVEIIEGGRLPLGIIDEVSPAVRQVDLLPGDVIIMFTDGVCDAAAEGDSEWLTSALLSLESETSDGICREIIKAASLRREKNPDDMTAVAVTVAEAGM